MPQLSLHIDPRYFQVIFQAVFLAYGIIFLDWRADWLHYMISIGACLLFQYVADSLKAGRHLSLLAMGWLGEVRGSLIIKNVNRSKLPVLTE